MKLAKERAINGKLKMKDKLQDKNGLNVLIRHKGVSEDSKIFCDKIEYMHDRGTFQGEPIFDHHLMFWDKGNLIFKVWLKNKATDKRFRNINEAMKSVGIKVWKY